MKDVMRIRILKLLKEQGELTSSEIYRCVLDDMRDATEAQVHGTLIELSFEGLVKIVHEPTCSLTTAGKQAS